jgi:hypothetical protein
MEKTENPSFEAMIPCQARDEDGQDNKSPTSTQDTPAALKLQKVEIMDSAEFEHENLTGFRLILTLLSLTMVAFLMLLDVSVISTVS